MGRCREQEVFESDQLGDQLRKIPFPIFLKGKKIKKPTLPYVSRGKKKAHIFIYRKANSEYSQHSEGRVARAMPADKFKQALASVKCN